ncbi:hypothetical protein BS47DRAFT_1296410 [Hydnum rufescens UP504]|uniref:Ankyrin n=1 Tax=Hydnum rufescens UP504 TaxID=1448309 RepID=A0A9P6AWJ7_9AGAM|nr:hypothetical protein BS47DRAFT_1296410 [Hydnum rufescens UP504]
MHRHDESERLRRSIKENNLFLVRRILARIGDMRNTDPGHGRYTSLAWAAVCAHEEIYGYLLGCGHDDDELSRDAENNTILILLAGLPLDYLNPNHMPSPRNEQAEGSAIRMAQAYYQRFPFLIDWSNVQGKTALHVAALKGNDDFARMLCDLDADFDLPDVEGNTPLHYASAWGHIPIVQLLIERGCQFAAKNNEGFTASDYAYSLVISLLPQFSCAQSA